jgi:hypothetical protein
MLAPDTGWRVGPDPAVRRVYGQSGLYRKGGGPALWTVAWYSREVFPSSDGVHLARMGPLATSVEGTAVSFYRKGQEIRRYRIADLVRDESRLKRSATFLHWRRDVSYDDRSAIVSLTTLDERTYRFSLQTGDIAP